MGVDSGQCSLSRWQEGHGLDDPKDAVFALRIGLHYLLIYIYFLDYAILADPKEDVLNRMS